MRPWFLFSSGIVVGLLIAAGFGFAWPGEPPLKNPAASFPQLPQSPEEAGRAKSVDVQDVSAGDHDDFRRTAGSA